MKNFLPVILFAPLLAFSQTEPADSNSLKSFLKKGKFSAHARSFVMHTWNEGALKDDAAWAVGAGIGYETPVWKGFSAGMSGYFIFNAASTNLAKPDAVTGQKNRYEIGLFDITDPANKNDLDRMEELFVKYNRKKTTITFGRQFINTPFINKQDGRMRPTIVEGVWMKTGIKESWSFETGWLLRMSPRTTVSWYNTGESIGIYAPGVNTDGVKSSYPGNTSSKGILLTGVQFKNKSLHVQVWNTWVENIMNTTLIQPAVSRPVSPKQKLRFALQYIYQHSSGNGGNAERSKAYYEPGAHTWLVSAQAELQSAGHKTNINYTHISHAGRFLMPREWGREYFFTFMPRERNEGLGGVNAYTLNHERNSRNQQWKWAAGYGIYFLPAPDLYRLNKYGMPSYHQLNVLAEHRCKGWLQHLDIQLLLALKKQLSGNALKPSYVINKVNMLNTNFVVNYHF